MQRQQHSHQQQQREMQQQHAGTEVQVGLWCHIRCFASNRNKSGNKSGDYGNSRGFALAHGASTVRRVCSNSNSNSNNTNNNHNHR